MFYDDFNEKYYNSNLENSTNLLLTSFEENEHISSTENLKNIGQVQTNLTYLYEPFSQDNSYLCTDSYQSNFYDDKQCFKDNSYLSLCSDSYQTNINNPY